jgi:O-antigen/teichoic acid export membrane protein
VASEIIGLKNISEYIKQILFFNLVFATILFTLMLINIKVVANFLHINSFSLLLITFLIPILSLFPFSLNGILQGLQLFRPFAMVNLSLQFFRLVFGVPLVIIGFGIFGALSGSFLGAICGLMLVLFFTRFYLSWPPFKIRGGRIKQTIKKALSYFGYTGAFFFLLYIDIPLVKHFFTSQQTGFYSAAALLGKVPVYLIGSMGMVVFPKIVEMKRHNKPHFRFFTLAILIALLLLIIIAIGYVLLAKLAVKMLFGNAYLPAVPLVKYFGLCAIPLALASISVSYSLGIEKKRFLCVLWLCALGFVVSLCLFHSLPHWAIWWLGIWSLMITVSVFAGNLLKSLKF